MKKQLLNLGLIGVAAAIPALAFAASGDLSGVWIPSQAITAIKTDAGALPPLNAKGLKVYQARVRARAQGKPIPDSTTYCQPDGVPRLMYAMKPFIVLETPGQITFVHQKGHNVRIVRLNGTPSTDDDQNFLGHSAGTWTQNDLVVDTTGFNDVTTLDQAGLPHGTKLHVVETYHSAPDSPTMKVSVRIEDPEFYTKPWTTSLTLKRLPGARIVEDVCQLNNPMFKSYFINK